MAVIISVVGLFLVWKAISDARARKAERVAACSVSGLDFKPSAEFKEYQREQERIRREQIRENRELERQRKAGEQKRRQAEKLKVDKQLASSEREFVQHRLEQIQNLINIAEDEQIGTCYGGKEWIKYEKQIMAYEAQAQALKQRARKARATMNRT